MGYFDSLGKLLNEWDAYINKIYLLHIQQRLFLNLVISGSYLTELSMD